MRTLLRQCFSAAASVAVAVILLSSGADAQAPVTLQEQLTAQYKVVKIGPDGTVENDAVTVLAVQKAGIIAVPWNAKALCAAKFQDNVLHLSTGFCAGMMKSVSKYFKKGSKVYPAKIEVNVDKAKISVQIVGCRPCYKLDPALPMKGEVVFEFAKGYLEKVSAGEVEDVIGQVFAISTGDDQQAQGGGETDQQQPAEQQQPAQQPAQAEPQTVQVGMTTDQVQGILGKPDKIFNVGTKQIYVYKDVKITFLNGKVSDVQ